ncbi:uncharacterized protein EDB91DRAFT_1090281, partial [Suillus paluster]|uniref:uncharacterized protein n=1 Tax=Suillus paluster TaxID=48578 RepID=UPI001B876867
MFQQQDPDLPNIDWPKLLGALLASLSSALTEVNNTQTYIYPAGVFICLSYFLMTPLQFTGEQHVTYLSQALDLLAIQGLGQLQASHHLTKRAATDSFGYRYQSYHMATRLMEELELLGLLSGGYRVWSFLRVSLLAVRTFKRSTLIMDHAAQPVWILDLEHTSHVPATSSPDKIDWSKSWTLFSPLCYALTEVNNWSLGQVHPYIFGFRREGVAEDSLASQYQSYHYGGHVPQDSLSAGFQSYGAAGDYLHRLEAASAAAADDHEDTEISTFA